MRRVRLRALASRTEGASSTRSAASLPRGGNGFTRKHLDPRAKPWAMLRILSLVLLLAAPLLLPVATAGTYCLPRGDGQDLACVGILVESGARLCVYEMVNPPLPGTYQTSYTCGVSCDGTVQGVCDTLHRELRRLFGIQIDDLP